MCIRDSHDARIQLTDDVGILMSYPNFGTVSKAQTWKEGKETEQLFEMIADCMYQYGKVKKFMIVWTIHLKIKGNS